LAVDLPLLFTYTVDQTTRLFLDKSRQTKSKEGVVTGVEALWTAVFEYIAAVDFVQQFVQTSSAKQVMLNSP